MAAPFNLNRGLRLRLKPSDSAARTLRRVFNVVASVDPPAQAAAGYFGFDVTVTGVAVTDACIAVIPSASLEANLRVVSAVVSTVAANTIRVTMQALAVIDGAAFNWTFVILS